MPTYKMKCTNKDCQEEREVFLFPSELTQAKCKKCGSPMQQVWTPNSEGGFILKGSGWFKKGGY